MIFTAAVSISGAEFCNTAGVARPICHDANDIFAPCANHVASFISAHFDEPRMNSQKFQRRRTF
jgi:hypothetical protein